jgi:hypothetical protein
MIQRFNDWRANFSSPKKPVARVAQARDDEPFYIQLLLNGAVKIGPRKYFF